jgi:uncharacterized membrane protein
MNSPTFADFVDNLITYLFMPLPYLFIAAAIVFFLWNIFKLIAKADQAEERAKFKSQAVWGIVAIAVMLSIWGLVNFVTDSLQMDSSGIYLDQYDISF